ncbi:MAG: DUF1311 domain-containing protein [Clostridia bacterium]|nr:DUF1311 domain-containing protein [Oscillospiraceae bacterium]MBQ7033305.1 DUF1311 domain-containing protein [Clostridia bacterium]
MKQRVLAAMLAVCFCMTGCMLKKTKVKREKPEEVPTASPIQTALPEETPQQVSFVKDSFLERAAAIEAYEAEHLQTAMTQMEINQEAYAAYEKWDVLLNDVWGYLKDTLPTAEYNALLAEQLDWIDAKEAAMEAASVEWQGGTGEPMARYGEGATYTRERCYELIDLI